MSHPKPEFLMKIGPKTVYFITKLYLKKNISSFAHFYQSFSLLLFCFPFVHKSISREILTKPIPFFVRKVSGMETVGFLLFFFLFIIKNKRFQPFIQNVC